MTPKPLQKAIDRYHKTGNMKSLSRTLIKMILYMAKNAEQGYEVKELDQLPAIVDSLKSLDLNKKRKD